MIKKATAKLIIIKLEKYKGIKPLQGKKNKKSG